MNKKKTSIGLVSHGLYLPEGLETAQEISLKAGLSLEQISHLGIRQKCRPSPEDHPIPMAVKAARMALERAPSVDPMGVDVVIWTGEEYKDYIAQTAAIRLQEEVGCRKAWAFDLVGQGVTLLQGFRVGRDLILGDDTIHTVLLAGGTRNVDLVDYTHPHTRFLLAASASGGAVILKRGAERNCLLATAFSVDPGMADEVYVPGGGTEIPFSTEILGGPLLFFQVQRPEKVAPYIEDTWPERLGQIIRRVLPKRRPDYLALRHLTPAHRHRILEALGLEPHQSLSLEDWGHHGTNDPLLSLDLALRKGQIKDGDQVVLASAGIGFSYASVLLQWGPWDVSADSAITSSSL